MVWLHKVYGVPENVMGDVRRVMMNPLKYLHLEGEGEALEAMILFKNGQWAAGRGQEELFELMVESGMVDNWGPQYEEECEALRLLDTDEGIDEAHEKAYEDWVASGEDISAPSYFSDYVGFPEPVGTESPGFAMMEKMGWTQGEGLGQDGIVDPICKMIPSLLRDDRGNVSKFTPEMLEQREQLNWNFNFLWNTPQGPGGGRPWCNWVRPGSEDMHIPDQYGEIELVSVGENHGVAKSPTGSVFVPRGVLKFLGSKAQVGQEFSASLEFVEGARYPWRVVKNSVQHIN